MGKIAWVVVVCFSVTTLSGCGMMWKKDVEHMEKVQTHPVNCATAEQDLKTLEEEKKGVAERIAAGVTSIAPPALIMGILTGTADDKFKVATGKYDKMIDERIAKIKSDCGK